MGLSSASSTRTPRSCPVSKASATTGSGSVVLSSGTVKENVLPSDPSFQKTPPFMSSSKNWALIRLADLLLWKAEALIELNRAAEARPIINQLRARAQKSTARLKNAAGAGISNYLIGEYPATNWTQDYARQALRYERRMEFAMEGYRFFDLVRWGIAGDYLNTYFDKEKTKRL